MSDVSKQIDQHFLFSKPWLNAQPMSIWEISGEYPGGKGSFENCLAVVLPPFATEGAVIFRMIGALDDTIAPEWISRALELILVHADRTLDAYFQRDQVIIDMAKAAQS